MAGGLPPSPSRWPPLTFEIISQSVVQLGIVASGGPLTMSIIWTIIIGFVAGIIAKLIHSGPNEPSGFILTTLLGVAGSFVATYLGQALGWYHAGEGAGFIGSVVGAIIVLFVWGYFAPKTTT